MTIYEAIYNLDSKDINFLHHELLESSKQNRTKEQIDYIKINVSVLKSRPFLTDCNYTK